MKLIQLNNLLSRIYPVSSQNVTFVQNFNLRYKITAPPSQAIGLYPDDEGNKKSYYKFDYYPRFPGEEDPPYEPTKLFAVRRTTKTLTGRPYWERRVVEGRLKLRHLRDVAIVKNSPTENYHLYQVKHLVKITPITFPNGFPKDQKDGFLKENGEFVNIDRLAPIGAESLEQVNEDVDTLRKKNVDGLTLKNRLRLQWESRY